MFFKAIIVKSKFWFCFWFVSENVFSFLGCSVWGWEEVRIDPNEFSVNIVLSNAKDQSSAFNCNIVEYYETRMLTSAPSDCVISFYYNFRLGRRWIDKLIKIKRLERWRDEKWDEKMELWRKVEVAQNGLKFTSNQAIVLTHRHDGDQIHCFALQKARLKISTISTYLWKTTRPGMLTPLDCCRCEFQLHWCEVASLACVLSVYHRLRGPSSWEEGSCD